MSRIHLLLAAGAMALAVTVLPAQAQMSKAEAAARTDAAIEAEATAEAGKITDVDSYLAARRAQLKEAEDGDYGKVPRPDMDRLRTAFATVERLLQGRTDAMELPQQQRVELFNAQQTIDSILDHQASTALICERVKATGSHMRSNRCHTRKQREERRMAEQDGMRTNHMTPPCVGNDC